MLTSNHLKDVDGVSSDEDQSFTALGLFMMLIGSSGHVKSKHRNESIVASLKCHFGYFAPRYAGSLGRQEAVNTGSLPTDVR